MKYHITNTLVAKKYDLLPIFLRWSMLNFYSICEFFTHIFNLKISECHENGLIFAQMMLKERVINLLSIYKLLIW